jgi:anti-sigma regulatory factor (Ser/Thr protein kinase)
MTEDRGQTKEEVALVVPSHPKYLYVIRSALYPLVLDAGFGKKEARRIILAVDEACSNIIKYAYEGDHEKTIDLSIVVGNEELRITLRDSGKKADVSKIAPRKLEEVRPGGLGTHFMNSLFETVDYDTSGKQGTVLTLVKKIPQDSRAR